jgi:CHAD domain-containing protein
LGKGDGLAGGQSRGGSSRIGPSQPGTPQHEVDLVSPTWMTRCETLHGMPQARAAKNPRATVSSPVRDHILTLMREQLESIRMHESGTRLGTDPEELHKMRTAVRRLRAILGAARDMFDPEWLDGLRGELDWLGKILGGLRDLDVLRDYLRTELASLKLTGRVAGQALLDRLDAERGRARDRLLATLDSARYARLLDRLGKAVRRPRSVRANLSLRAIAAGQFKKLRKAVKTLPKNPSDDDLHAVRIKVKRARYAAELAQAQVGRPAKRFVARAKEMQAILGEHQDAVVAEERLRTLLGGAHSRPVGRLANKLVKRQRDRREAAQMDFFERWPKLARRGQKAWK